MFCEGCGQPLGVSGRCPKCGATTLPGGDICEVCGAWLLTGQCCFCYAPLDADARFCPACGNPVDGVVCPGCHKQRIFDFCPECNIPLTRQALELLEDLRKDAEISRLIEALGETSPVSAAGQEGLADKRTAGQEVLEELKRYYGERKSKAKASSSASLFGSADFEEAMQQVSKAQESDAKLKESQALSLLKSVQKRTFNTNQEARRFFGALKVLLPVMNKTLVGWLCNAYQCLHPEGPSACADPAPGGEWIFRVEYEMKEVEI